MSRSERRYVSNYLELISRLLLASNDSGRRWTKLYMTSAFSALTVSFEFFPFPILDYEGANVTSSTSGSYPNGPAFTKLWIRGNTAKPRSVIFVNMLSRFRFDFKPQKRIHVLGLKTLKLIHLGTIYAAACIGRSIVSRVLAGIGFSRIPRLSVEPVIDVKPS